MQEMRGGQGAGQNRGELGLGPGGECICPSCGYRETHQRGVPCYGSKCPKCKTPLMRENNR